jgi:hypothetical protein
MQGVASRFSIVAALMLAAIILYGCPANDESYMDCSRKGKPLQWDAQREKWHCGDR